MRFSRWIFLLAISVSATCQIGFSQTGRTPVPFDSWGSVNGEDASTRLDNFALQLQNDNTATGVLICYGPEGEGHGTGKFILRLMKDYLLNTRGMDPNRIETIYGGRYKNVAAPFIQAWIVPYGQAWPEAVQYQSKLPVQRGKIREYERSDDISEVSDECACGPSQGDVELASLAESIRNQPDDVIYLVAYNLPASAPGAWRRVVKIETDYLQKFGIGAERIRSIFGGTAKADGDDEPSVSYAKIELWVLPSSARAPVKAATAESSPTEAIKFGEYNHYSLENSDEEKRIIQRVFDVVESSKELRVCFVVRPSIPNPSDSELLLPADASPEVDVVKVVESWKQQLAGKPNIDGARIVIIPAAADEENQGTVEVWLLPPGISVPNPYASKEASP